MLDTNTVGYIKDRKLAKYERLDKLGFKRLENQNNIINSEYTKYYGTSIRNEKDAPVILFTFYTNKDKELQIIITVRGTATSADIKTDFLAITNSKYSFMDAELKAEYNLPDKDGNIPYGFNKYTRLTILQLGEIIQIIQEFTHQGYLIKNIICMGHSLGGAVATLMAPILSTFLSEVLFVNEIKSISILAVGSPKSLDKITTEQSYKLLKQPEKTFIGMRIFNHNDVVSKVPPRYIQNKHLLLMDCNDDTKKLYKNISILDYHSYYGIDRILYKI